MSIRSALQLTASVVTVTRTVETPDGMGGLTSTSTIIGLVRAAIWSPGESKSFLSDKIARVSSDVLVTETAAYTFTSNDALVSYAGVDYKITSQTDNVLFKGILSVTGLERIV